MNKYQLLALENISYAMRKTKDGVMSYEKMAKLIYENLYMVEQNQLK